MTHAQHSAAPAHAAFSLTGLHCLDCADAVERSLKANPHITSVHIDWPNSVAHVGYHLSRATMRTIRGFAMRPSPKLRGREGLR